MNTMRPTYCSSVTCWLWQRHTTILSQTDIQTILL